HLDGLPGYDITAYNNSWIHLAGVWDRQGIAGTTDTMRLYLNGVEVASTTQNGWGTTVGTVADIDGGNDADIVGKFSIDNLKLWSGAKTDFSDRFGEGGVTPGQPFLITGSMGEARSAHTATLLPSGRVLVVGGSYCDNVAGTCNTSATAELYDPSA